jgi:tRNA A-37 threonylcarbamoyl transferase component Bud32
MNAVSLQPGAALVHGAIRWHLSAAGRDALLPAHLDLVEHLQRGTAQIVKHGPHRTVYKICLGDFNIFWKHCRISDIGSYLRQCIRPPKARLEFDSALALAARGVATVEPLAWGKSWWRLFGPSHLITRELVGATPLHTFLLERSKGRPRRDAAALLGQYLAQLHEAGVAHPDLHPGNVLVVIDLSGQPRFHLLDIHNVRIGAPLTPEQSRENLAVFNRWFIMRSERSDRLRFWNRYAEVRRFGTDEMRTLARDIEKRTFESNQAFWKKRDDRCVASNRYFQQVRTSGVFGHAVKEFDAGFMQELLADPDRPFRGPDCRLFKDSSSSTVVEIVVPTPLGPRAMIYKRFKLKKSLTSIANRFRRSAALRSWRMGHALLDRGLPTPRPWLVLHRRGLSGPREGYLLCEKVESTTDLHDYLTALASVEEMRYAIADLGRLLLRLHRAGIRHRDLKAPNLLAAKTVAGHRFDFIDLVGMRLQQRLPDSRRARDLTRLNASFIHSPRITHTDRLRFLRAYLCWGLRGRADWKLWWNRISQATQVKIARNKRAGRPLA